MRMKGNRKQRVLVTGSAGYLGCVMVETLQNRGHDVVGLDAGFFNGTLKDQAECPCPTFVRDIREICVDDLEGYHAVVHLAALCNDPLGNLNSGWTQAINFEASLKLAQMAKEAGVKRFLYASSCSMYGATGSAALDETAPLNPLTPYAQSKVASELAISSLASDDFSPVFLRNATVYGISPRLRIDLVLNNLVGWAHTTGKVRILSDGTPWRPIVHVRDLCQAFAVTLEASRERIHNQAFNVGRNEDNYQVRDLAEIVRQTVPGCELEFAGQSNPDSRDYRVDFSKLHATFPEFEPVWDARKGAAEIYDAYLSADLKEPDLTSRKFTRLAQLKHLIDKGALDRSLRWSRWEALAA
jgi:nucleoside-diphosphate-sugar epimerase